MAGFNGRELTVDWNSTTLVGVRQKGITISAEPVDVTTDDNNGERTILPDPGVRSAEISVVGVTSDEILIAEIMSGVEGRTLVGATINLPSSLASPGTIAGDFFVSSLELNGESNGAFEFTATLMSAGALTYTASSA